MGDGPSRDDFINESKDLNVTFTGRLSYDQMCSVLFSCDIVINPIVGMSVASIINKHADYAASGKAVINTQNSDEYRGLIDAFKMGYNCNTYIDIANSLKELMDNKDLRERMGANARRCAEEKFDRRNTYEELVKIITGESLWETEY